MAQSPGPIELSSPPSSSHHSHHSSYDPYSLDNDFLDSPSRSGGVGGGTGDDDDFMGGMGMGMGDMDTLDMMGMGGIEMGMNSPTGMGGMGFGDSDVHGLGAASTGLSAAEDPIGFMAASSPSPPSATLPQQQQPSGVESMMMPLASTSKTDSLMDGHSPADDAHRSSGANSAQSGGTPTNVNNIDISSMPTHAQMQSLFGASGFKMDKQAYAAALSQHQAQQQQSRGSSGEQDEDEGVSAPGVNGTVPQERNKRGKSSDEGNADDEDNVEFVSSSRTVSRGDADDERTPKTTRTRSVSNKRRKRDQDGQRDEPPVPPLPLEYTNGVVKMEHALPASSSGLDVPSTPRMNGSRALGAPNTPGRNLNQVNGISSPEVGSKAAVQRSLGIGGGSGPSGPKTPRKATLMSGRKRVRDGECSRKPESTGYDMAANVLCLQTKTPRLPTLRLPTTRRLNAKF